MITVTVPSQLQRLTGERPQLFIQIERIVQEPTVGVLFDCMEEEAPGIKNALLDLDGKLKPFISMFIGPVSVKTLLEDKAKRIEALAKSTNKQLKPPELVDLVLTGYEEIIIMPATYAKRNDTRTPI